ncbi:hypothetical protein RHGRI_036222 [Rhododendron griersonianum]|uniref:RING-type domain-containing protein n=1 Tax=Rhododendron griersonianum TaxID=479676 RepID=A0AAV6HQ72_9ERIC|nr:hypothetical protein RHGRI_036222 [Rhododendron griersonianum]
MERESDPEAAVSAPSTSDAIEAPPPFSQVDEEREESSQFNPGDNHHQQQHSLQQQQHRLRRRWPPGVSYRLNISISDVASTQIRDDVWSILIVLVTFWFFASMTVILGYYGSEELPLGPNCSRLMQANPFFVQSIKAQEIDESKHGPMLYGFYETPPLDVEIAWSETHKASIQSNYHKAKIPKLPIFTLLLEWEYFLNQGSKVDISYSVKSPSSSPLSLVIAQGRENLIEWIEDPSYPNTTLSWNIIHGDGVIYQEIFSSKMYYIAVGNLNSEEVEVIVNFFENFSVQLNFTLNGFLYNTTRAYYKCSLSHQLCSLKLFLLRANVAVLTSPGMDQVTVCPMSSFSVTLPQKLFICTMTVIILLAFRICNMFQILRGDESGFRVGDTVSERAPLLSRKDDDLLSWGSSYDSLSHDEEEVDEWLAVASLDGKPLKEDGEANSNLRRLCVMCFDAPRDCFFLPCGHCAACFACGTRIIEEAGNCPICRRTTKKVRKIFTV